MTENKFLNPPIPNMNCPTTQIVAVRTNTKRGPLVSINIPPINGTTILGREQIEYKKLKLVSPSYSLLFSERQFYSMYYCKAYKSRIYKYTGVIEAVLTSKDHQAGYKDNKISERRLSKIDNSFGFVVLDCVCGINKRWINH